MHNSLASLFFNLLTPLHPPPAANPFIKPTLITLLVPVDITIHPKWLQQPTSKISPALA